MLNDVPINGALIVFKWCTKDEGTMHEMIKNDDREPWCTFMYRALAILKLNITLIPTLKSCSLSINNSEKSSINF